MDKKEIKLGLNEQLGIFLEIGFSPREDYFYHSLIKRIRDPPSIIVLPTKEGWKEIENLHQEFTGYHLEDNLAWGYDTKGWHHLQSILFWWITHNETKFSKDCKSQYFSEIEYEYELAACIRKSYNNTFVRNKLAEYLSTDCDDCFNLVKSRECKCRLARFCSQKCRKKTRHGFLCRVWRKVIKERVQE